MISTTILTCILTWIKETIFHSSGKKKAYFVHDLAPKAGSNYDINEDPIMIRAIFGRSLPGEERLMQAQFVEIFAREIINVQVAEARFMFSLVNQKRKQKERLEFKQFNAMLYCLNGEEIRAYLSNYPPSTMPKDLWAKSYEDNNWGFFVANLERPFGSELDLTGRNGSCWMCGRAIYFTNGCHLCKRYLRLVREVSHMAEDRWREIVWMCFDCPLRCHRVMLEESRV